MTARTSAIVVAASCIAFAVGIAVSQNQGGPDENAIKRQMMAALEQKGQPAPEHQRLEALVGDFDLSIAMMMGPGVPPVTARSSAHGRWVLGGRFVQITSDAAEGELFSVSSISYVGFDKRKSKYFWWGIDSTDTYSVFAEGDYDEGTRSLVLYGTNIEPELGGQTRFKTTFVLEAPDAHTMSVAFEVPAEMRAMMPEDAVDAEGFIRIMESRASRR